MSDQARAGLGPAQQGLDHAIHSPIRLVVMSALDTEGEAEFGYLRDLTSASDSLLSKHLSVLAARGYVSIRKGRVDRTPVTWVSVTSQGREAFTRYRHCLNSILPPSN